MRVSPIALLLPLDGDLEGRDRDGPITATGSGALRWVPGKGGYPARINYARNPTADESDNLFANIGIGYSVTRTWEPNGGRDGKGCVRWDCDGTIGFQGGTTSTASNTSRPGELWSVGAWVKGPEGKNGRLLLREGGSGSFSDTSFQYTGDWQWVTMSRVLTDPDQSQVQLRIDNAGFPNTVYSFWVDDVIITPGEIADEHDGRVNGELGPGYGWLGTPHDSPSYREAWVYGGAALVEEATTNYNKDPFNTSLASWSYSGTSHNESLDNGWIKLERTDTNTSMYALQYSAVGTFAPGDPVSCTVTVKGSREGLPFVIVDRPADAASTVLDWVSNSPLFYTPAPGEELEIKWTSTNIKPEGTSRVQFGIAQFGDTPGHQVGDTIWFKRFQIEKKPYPTSFCPQLDRDGNLLPGYSWTGTEHASPSTRDAASIELEYPHAFSEAILRYSEDDGETWQTESIYEPGAFGTYGTLDLSDGVLTIGVTSHAVWVDQLIVFDRQLSAAERTLLGITDKWHWNMFDRLPRPVIRIGRDRIGPLRVGKD